MAEVTSRNEGFTLPIISDPEVRRALRAVYDELSTQLARQQTQIDALLEVVLERHLTSVGEFRRQIMRLQQDRMRSVRLHEALASATAPGQVPAAAPQLAVARA
jgi:hypothetical protein